MQTDDTLKSDEKDLDAGCVLFRAIFRAAITRGDSAGQTAVAVLKQFIDLAGPANPNLDQRTFEVLHELTKDAAPMGCTPRRSLKQFARLFDPTSSTCSNRVPLPDDHATAH